MVDRIAARYGRFPHEVLALDAADLNIAVLCCLTGDAARMARIKQINANKGMVFPIAEV